MVVESYIYSVFVTVLGMVIVFSFLTFLSLMMIALKKSFKEKKEAIQPAVLKSSGVESDKDIDWIKAAVSAFLAYESAELNTPSARLWQPQALEEFDPWLTGRRG